MKIWFWCVFSVVLIINIINSDLTERGNLTNVNSKCGNGLFFKHLMLKSFEGKILIDKKRSN